MAGPGRGDGQDNTAQEVYFEFAVIGHTVKVTAIDGATGVEVADLGPLSASRADLERLALGKLKARLRREQAG